MVAIIHCRSAKDPTSNVSRALSVPIAPMHPTRQKNEAADYFPRDVP